MASVFSIKPKFKKSKEGMRTEHTHMQQLNQK